MPSSFKGLDIFGPGPHRFAMGEQGNAVVPVSVYTGAFLPGSISYGMLDLEVIVTGRLVAETEAALWVKRDAITAQLQQPPSPGTLIDHHGRTWTTMSLWRYEEGPRTDRGRTRSLSFRALFRKDLLSTGGATET